jgi:hypothetical protein
MGMPRVSLLVASSSPSASKNGATMPVRMKAGWIELQRTSIFCRVQSIATDLVSIATAALEVL